MLAPAASDVAAFRPMRMALFFSLTLILCSCASDKQALTWQEAELRADADIRHGVIMKHNRQSAILAMLKPNAPQKASTKTQIKRLDASLIEKRAIENAGKTHFTSIRRQYNDGLISRQRCEAMIEHQREQALAALIALGPPNIYAPSPTPLPQMSVPQFSPGRFQPDSLSNPYGAGSPYKADGLMNPYSRYGNKYSNESWTNPYATNAPAIVDENGKYHGRLSTNKYDPDSISNPNGKYGNKYSPDSINNPYGAGNPYSGTKLYVIPQR